jgi:hypothetical protein
LDYKIFPFHEGLPDGFFQTKNPKLGKFRWVLQWKMMVYFMDTWVHFTVFCFILWTFGIVRRNLAYISPFWYFVPRKIWQPWFHARNRKDIYEPCMHMCEVKINTYYLAFNSLKSQLCYPLIQIYKVDKQSLSTPALKNLLFSTSDSATYFLSPCIPEPTHLQ